MLHAPFIYLGAWGTSSFFVFVFDGVMCTYTYNFNNILINKKLYENIPVDNISYKDLTVPKSLRIRFNKIDGFIISLGGKIKHLVLFDCELLDKIEYLLRKTKYYK